jgi:hypothetical protein
MCKHHERASGVVPSNVLLGSDNVERDFADGDDEAETEPTPFLLKRKAAIPY